MSILSSTGLGKYRARMLFLYGKRKLFYEELDDLAEVHVFYHWEPKNSKVYNSDDYKFILEYIERFGWFDEEFVERIKQPDYTKTIPGVAYKITSKMIGVDLVPVQPMEAPQPHLFYFD